MTTGHRAASFHKMSTTPSIRVSHSVPIPEEPDIPCWTETYSDHMEPPLTSPNLLPSEALCKFMGVSSGSSISYRNILQSVFDYVKKNGLLNKTKIIQDAVLTELIQLITPDAVLTELFQLKPTDSLTILTLGGYLRRHYTKMGFESDFTKWWLENGYPSRVNVKTNISQSKFQFAVLYDTFNLPAYKDVTFVIYTGWDKTKTPCGCGWCHDELCSRHCSCESEEEAMNCKCDDEGCGCVSATAQKMCQYHWCVMKEYDTSDAARCGCSLRYHVVCDYHSS